MAAIGATQLFFPSPQWHVFTFSVHLGLSPAWKPRLSLCSPLLCVCVWACVSVCTRAPLAPPGSPALLFQPGVSKFWFPLGLSGNWKQRLSLEVCFVFVCMCARLCVCVLGVRSLCFCTSGLCMYAFIFKDLSVCWRANRYPVSVGASVAMSRQWDFTETAWWMNKIWALGVLSISASHAELEAWPEAVQVSGYL